MPANAVRTGGERPDLTDEGRMYGCTIMARPADPSSSNEGEVDEGRYITTSTSRKPHTLTPAPQPSTTQQPQHPQHSNLNIRTNNPGPP
ncbi:MAG: hypothetical protein M1831_004748 [Alyxoria varia]|nr:MAG: hypothetical protein M1831_004748 [Alyxoria varia]